MNQRVVSLFLGTAFIGFALLYFEISTVRTINFVVGPSFIYNAIAFAMLGLSAAGSILTLVNLRRYRYRQTQILVWGCVGIAVLMLFSNFVTAGVKADLNATLQHAGRISGLSGIATKLVSHSLLAAIEVGGTLLIPYFLFGALLSFLFVTTEPDDFGTIYGADLLGAALGCIAAILAMATTSYSFSVSIPAVFAFLAAAAYGARMHKALTMIWIGVALGLGVLSTTSAYDSRIEPPADPHYLIRDYAYRRHVKEIWHGWNSYTRVGAESLGPHGRMSLGNGEGMAWLPPTDLGTRPWRYRATIPALLLDPPQNALVLFAGAGADIVSLRENGVKHVWGVEINRVLVNGAMGLKKYRVKKLLAGKSSHLIVAEGRNYLASDKRRYGLILLSYSGAPVEYYAGAESGTVQYLYTYQGLASVLDHLKPNGYAVFLQVNKVDELAALRRYLAVHHIADPMRTAIVLYHPYMSDGTNAWDGVFDNNPLLIKPSGWTKAEVAKIKRHATAYGYRIAYAPGLRSADGYAVYRRILAVHNYKSFLAALTAQTHRRFEIKTDNRPFIFDMFPSKEYLHLGFWLGPFTKKQPLPFELFRWFQILFLLIITIATAAFVLAPLWINGGPPISARTLSHLGYFVCLGAGFMIMEVALMQTMGILFESPGQSIAIVIASMILFAGLGSLMSSRNFMRGLTFRMVAVAVLFYAIALHLFVGTLTHAMLPWLTFAKAVTVVLLVAPGAYLMGHLFPQGLAAAARDDIRLVPWAWGVNGAMSTVCAGIVPFLAMAFGYDALFLIAATFYALIIILPTTRSRVETHNQ